MQLLTVFSIIALVLIIASSNISFKSGNDVNTGINTRVPPINSTLLLLSIDDKSIFSSLLQTISAQEQENGTNSDAAVVKRGGEEQDRGGDTERKSSIGQEQEQNRSQGDVQKQDKIKEVCDSDRVNNNDSRRVDSEDSNCLTNRNEQQQDKNHQQEDKEKLPTGEAASLDNKENDKGGENPISMEQQQNDNTSSNNNTSSHSSDTEHKAQNSQNLTDSHSTATTTNNNASLNEFHYANASAAATEDGFTLKCHPAETKMLPGEEGSITCTIENKTPKSIELVLECSGLDGTEIGCYINGEHPTETTLIKEMSYTNFSVVLVSRSSPPVPSGSYPFTISAEECINSDLC